MAARVQDGEAALQHVGEDGRDGVDAATVQDDVGEPVVGARREVDRVGVRPRDGVGGVELTDGRLGLLEQPRVLQRDRGMCGQRSEQDHLTRRERSRTPVSGQERAENPSAQQEWDAEDGPDPLLGDSVVDVVAVEEPVVGEVVVGEVRRTGLGDQAQQPGPQGEPQLAEGRRHRTVGHPDEGVTAFGVVETQVGEVGAEQLPGAAHDRGQQRVDVAQGRQVVGGLVQCRQLRLTLAVPDHLRADAECHGKLGT